MAKDTQSNRFVGGPSDIKVIPPKKQAKPKPKKAKRSK